MDFLEKLNSANKEIRKELGKEVKVLGRCECCGTCTLATIETEYYIVWKIFNSGMNKNIENYRSGKTDYAYALWNLTEEQLEKTIEILKKYFSIEKPESKSECLYIKE